jgi:hypothetical protein
MNVQRSLQSAATLAAMVASALLFPGLGHAHPGPGPHDPVDATVHLLTSPDHLTELVAFGVCGVAIAIIAAVVLVRRRRG